MSTQSLFQERPLQTARSASPRRSGLRSVAMEVCLRGDARRIFHALTEPEYRETWLCVPGTERDSYVNASQEAESYQIDFYRAGKLDARVKGLYRFRRRHRLVFSWFDDCALDASESQVSIRIDGNFERSVLALHHYGIASERESRWLQAMWSASLEKLSLLL